MPIQDVVINPRVIYVSATQPTDLTEGKLWYDTINAEVKVSNGSTYVSVSENLDYLNSQQLEQALAIMKLQIDGTLPATDYDTMYLDIFSDSGGYDNTINTGTTTAFYNSTDDTYENPLDTANPVTDLVGFNAQGDSSQTNKRGMKFLTKKAGLVLTEITKVTACTATTAYLEESGTGTVLATATFVGDVATFSPPYVLLEDATSYYAVVDAGGGAYSFRQGTDPSYPVVRTNVNFTAEVSTTTESTSNTTNLISITTSDASYSDATIETNAITIPSNATAYYVYAHNTLNGTGALTYDIKFGSGSYQTGKSLETKYANSDAGTTFTLRLQLDGSSTSNYVQVEDYAVIIWL